MNAPELNALEYLWAHIKRSLATVALDRLEALVGNRLKRLQRATRFSLIGRPFA
ncbi:hypothetical protein [Streptomyces sp. 2231.1]|uniref:hypothetical protein n=1 Tax=Streptomyces sp. 2231.1 TaxID=1855347 RepID=UPI00159F9AD4|nr:hypothetical protein [Streptomyces sp. 2231.1]